MAFFVELSRAAGSQVLINADRIISIQLSPRKLTTLVMSNGAKVRVIERPSKILDALDHASVARVSRRTKEIVL
jgi:hypothetical protein